MIVSLLIEGCEGVYLSKEGTIAESYTNPQWGGSQWKNSGLNLTNCMTLAEVVNQPARFVYEYKTHGPKSKSNRRSVLARNVFVVDNNNISHDHAPSLCTPHFTYSSPSTQPPPYSSPPRLGFERREEHCNDG